jgi:hypothetical protein
MVRRALLLLAAAIVVLQACGLISAVDRTLIPAQGGAGGALAGGAGGCDPATCPGDDTTCRSRSCDDQAGCGFSNAAEATPCEDAANPDAQLCDGMGNCVECVVHTDCEGGLVCINRECLLANCGDDIQNGDETAVDCGGSCPGCANGEACAEAEDCISGYCTAGGSCAPCTSHGQCVAERFCDEPGPDGVCVPKRPIGEPCTGGVQCELGHCFDTRCCDVSCSGRCRSCLGADTGGNDGFCDLVAGGTDPALECGNPDACEDETCSGTLPACAPLPDDTSCNSGGGDTCCGGQCVVGPCP